MARYTGASPAQPTAVLAARTPGMDAGMAGQAPNTPDELRIHLTSSKLSCFIIGQGLHSYTTLARTLITFQQRPPANYLVLHLSRPLLFTLVG